MKLYSHNSQYPKPIPFRIRLSDGTTRTDPSTFTEEEIQSELASQWYNVRMERYQKIRDIAWRYERYTKYQRLNIAQVDDINRLDGYVQTLADIPQTQTDPYNVVWPSLHETIED